MNSYSAHSAKRDRRCSSVLLGLGLLLVHTWAVAELPTLYGQGYVRLGQSWEDGSQYTLPAPLKRLSGADERAYLQQVQSLEQSGGAYANGLAEPLSSLGQYYRSQGNYAKALDLYKSALHVLRINDGLNSQHQIPLLREMMDTDRLSGDMQSLDKRYQYFFRLYGNGYPPHTASRLQASLEYLRWQREAVRLELDGDPTQRLIDMFQLNKRILESAGPAQEVSPALYTQLVLSQIRNLYLVQVESDLPRGDSLFQSGPSLRSSRSADPINRVYTSRSIHSIHSGQDPNLDFRQQKLELIQQTSSRKGRMLLEALIARTDSSEAPAERARAHLELGDWLQWNGNRPKANKEYAQVVQILTGAGETSLLEQWLGNPVELPDNGAFWQAHRLKKGGRRVELTAEYDVTARGSARKIHVSATKPEDKAFLGRLRRKLAATRFRPRFATGEAEAVERLNRQYELIIE